MEARNEPPPRRSRKRRAEVDPTRIGQLLRLALSSDQGGEITAAVGALRRALCAAGMDLHQLADAAERGLRPAPVQQPQNRARPCLSARKSSKHEALAGAISGLHGQISIARF